MTTLPRWLTAVATAFLALAIVAILMLRGAGLQIAVGPSASPTSPTASATAGQPSPSEDPIAVLARIEAQVSELRGLPQPDIGPPDVINRKQLADELQAILDAEWTPAQLAADNLTLRAMGLLTEAQDIRDLTEVLLTGQVLGFYDFEDRRMVVVTDAGLTPLARITYAHEFTHAMQDAAFDTGKAHGPAAEDDDAALALLALEEGDATVEMFEWGFQHLTPDELAGVGATPAPDTSGVPQWMLRQLEFPYLAGFALVTQLRASGDWAAVDSAYREPPASTEQVLHPEKYLAREAPVAIADPGLAALMGEAWRGIESSTVGEAMLDIWLEELGVAGPEAAAAAAGWGGDRLAVARGPGGEWAMAWRMTWDTADEAAEFDRAYAQIGVDLPFATAMRSTGAEGRLVLHASSAATLDALVAALGS